MPSVGRGPGRLPDCASTPPSLALLCGGPNHKGNCGAREGQTPEYIQENIGSEKILKKFLERWVQNGTKNGGK